MTSILKMRGATLTNPTVTLDDLPFSRQKNINWLGGDSVTLSEYGVESINDYQNGQVYPTIDTVARQRVCQVETLNGINVLTFSPENFAAGTINAYKVLNPQQFNAKDALSFAMLVKSDATDYSSGYRAIFHIGMNNSAGSNVPMIRLQFTSNNAFGIVARHSSADETAEQVGISGLPAGYNVIFVELDYVNHTIKTKVNDASVVTRSAFAGISGQNVVSASAVVGIGGYLSASGQAGRTTMFSGGLREMSIFNGPLTDDEIDSVTSWLLSKRGILNS
ncbi:hypothetical protein [Klebsiella pneumoniae]|uniref:hypothetical protein n=1 Tax=Klebsiella pneumoniae TaxID=573 RepID=UPI000E2AC0E9|nr:hypothetical protein [Klebsiella pneumoniae]WGU84739.1 hypothetical protein QG930_15025 [Klebsiella pneumoniae]SVR75442.1 Uncharacterised protein [Klebsiella pneumoniae]SWN91829.1 Uncharacterised protein [Klebsiella pneumoniae]SYI97647.1 Uncharacterised protein [Klebsiella pneumoniae]SYS28733.1 Uncharacterised protein [Klebsiella pneumoniae]